MFCCPLCSKNFVTRGRLQAHATSHTKEKPHKCLTCSASFVYINSLKNHIKTVHEGTKIIKKKNTQCHVCDYKCCGKAKLKSHLLRHSSEKPLSCNMPGCSYKTKSESNLKEHLRGVHSDERDYNCPSAGCNYKAKTRGRLNQHLKTHSNEKPFVCTAPGCNFTCKVKTYLTAHTSKAHNDDKPFKCSICDYRAKYKGSLKVHQEAHSKIKRFQCPAPNCDFAGLHRQKVELHFDRRHRKQQVSCTALGCSYKCGSLAVLKRHSVKHELPILMCPGNLCNFSTRMKGSLLEHISRRHEDLSSASLVIPRKYSRLTSGAGSVVQALHCKNCDYQTEFPHRYDLHLKSHAGEENRKHVCEFCSSKFKSFKELEAHLQRHIREKPFKCSHCDYAAVNGGSIRGHARRIHHIHVIHSGSETEFDGKCHTCSINFSSYSEFVVHSMSHLRPLVVLQRIGIHVI